MNTTSDYNPPFLVFAEQSGYTCKRLSQVIGLIRFGAWKPVRCTLASNTVRLLRHHNDVRGSASGRYASPHEYRGIVAAEIGPAVKIVTGLVDALAGTFNGCRTRLLMSSGQKDRL